MGNQQSDQSHQSRQSRQSRQSHSGYVTMEDEQAKKNVLERVRDSKKRGPISEEDLIKYTGKTRAELMAWAENRPGVGKNQLVQDVPCPGGAGGGGMS